MARVFKKKDDKKNSSSRNLFKRRKFCRFTAEKIAEVDYKDINILKEFITENGKLIPDTAAARDVLEALGSKPVHLTGDRFKAKPRPNVPEKDKPTPAQRMARQRNIKKAQQARRTA